MTDQKKLKQKKTTKGKPITRAATGGIVGATVGYLSSPKNREKIVARVNKETLKNQSAKLGTFTKEKLGNLKDSGMEKSNNAIQNLKSSTSNLLKKDHDDGEDYVNEDTDEEEMTESTEEYDEIKEENEMLQERLQNLEEKMNRILEMNDTNNEENEAATAEETDEEEESQQEDEEPEEEESEENTEEEAKSQENKTKKNTKASKEKQNTKKGDSKKSTSNNKKQKSKQSTEKQKKQEEGDTGVSSDDDTSASA